MAIVLILLSSVASAGNFGAPFAFSDATVPSKTLVPGQTYTIMITARPNQSPSITYNQIALNPNVGSQFQIVGGTCNTTTAYVNGATCTVDVRFLGALPGSFTADLQMQCTAIAAVGGYSITCGNGIPGLAGTMARVVGTGVALIVDTLGRDGLTLLAALLFLAISVMTLKRRT